MKYVYIQFSESPMIKFWINYPVVWKKWMLECLEVVLLVTPAEEADITCVDVFNKEDITCQKP